MKRTRSGNRHAVAERGRHRRNTLTFSIRKAKPSDLPAVVKMSEGVEEIENYPGQRMKSQDFEHFVSGHGALMLVAVAPSRNGGKEETIGYVTVYKSDNYFYLPYAVTKKEWRRNGVGESLLRAVEKLAKEQKVEYILMSVYHYNSSVHTFLRARGYVPSKKLVQYSKIIGKKGRK